MTRPSGYRMAVPPGFFEEIRQTLVIGADHATLEEAESEYVRADAVSGCATDGPEAISGTLPVQRGNLPTD